MLYQLFNNYINHFAANDIVIRAIIACLLSFILSIFFGGKIIRFLQKKQIGESIRDLGLEGQLAKKGTPTMGGILIIASLLISSLLVCKLDNIYIQILIFVTLGCGAIGFCDDYIKVFKKNKQGLKGPYKIIAQLVIGIILALVLYIHPDIVYSSEHTSIKTNKELISPINIMDSEVLSNINSSQSDKKQVDNNRTKQYESIKLTKGTETTMPFVKDKKVDYQSLIPFNSPYNNMLSWLIYGLIVIAVVFFGSNGTNLTDGLDGLSAGSSAIVCIVIAIIAWLSNNPNISSSLELLYIPKSAEIAVFMSALLGALLGFLWYNSYPAQIFMGDTGSLCLGGIMGIAMLLLRKELLLPLLCGVFVVEGLSVIIQRYYFKYSRWKYGEGKRVFKMTPLHHHFQKEGIEALIQSPKKAITETKIVNRFWIIGIVLAIICLSILN